MEKNLELRLYNSLAKIFPHHAAEEQGNIQLMAMYGERVSFQIAYRMAKDWWRTWGRLKIVAPTGVQLELRRIRYIPGSMPQNYTTDENYLTTKSGLFPDLLEHFNPDQLPLTPGIWQTIWVDVEISAMLTTKEQIYISIENTDGEELAKGEVTIEPIPTELPPLTIPHTRWFHTDCLAINYGVEIFSEQHWEIIENFAAYAMRHGMNTLLTPIFTPPLDTAVGGERPIVQLIDVSVNSSEYTFGFDRLKRWVEMCKRIGVEYYEISHLFTQWGAKHAPKIIAQDGTRLFGWETDATGPEYTNFLQQLLPALTTKLEELGIVKKVIFHISDEPGISDLQQYTNARKIVEPYLSNYKIVDALTNYDFYKQGAVSVPIPSVDHIEPFLEGNIPELWCYYCCAQTVDVPNLFFSQPSYRNRVLGVLLYKYNIAGFLQWGYNFYNSMHSLYPVDPFVTTDADGAFPSGDPFIVYPGPEGQPLGSVRLMVAQEAFYDLRALRLLEKLAGREYVLNLIDEGLSQPITFSCYPQGEWVFGLRQRVNIEIAKRIDLLRT